MKKLLAIGAMFGSLAILTPTAHAATATGTFDVLITLTPKCEINSTEAATGAVINNISLTYTSFQTAAATATTSFNVRCTNLLGYTLSLDSLGVTDDALDLAYTLAFTTGGSSGTGDGTSPGASHTVEATIAAGQGGTCAGPMPTTCDNAGATNNTRTLTVTY